MNQIKHLLSKPCPASLRDIVMVTLSSVFLILLLLSTVAAFGQEATPEMPVVAAPQQGALDYGTAAALALTGVGGAGMTWLAKKNFKTSGSKTLLLNGLFTLLSAAAAGKMNGMTWSQAGMLAGVGFATNQVPYLIAKSQQQTKP